MYRHARRKTLRAGLVITSHQKGNVTVCSGGYLRRSKTPCLFVNYVLYEEG